MEPIFDHEKLDVYRLALEFVAWVARLLDESKGATKARIAELNDQIDRASLSILLNIAEGNGKRQMPVRGKFFDDARGSAAECAACLDAYVAKGLCGADRIREGKEKLLRIVAMLCGLIDKFSQHQCVRESGCEDWESNAGRTDENEDEKRGRG
jgi:four helix bundle protein